MVAPPRVAPYAPPPTPLPLALAVHQHSGGGKLRASATINGVEVSSAYVFDDTPKGVAAAAFEYDHIVAYHAPSEVTMSSQSNRTTARSGRGPLEPFYLTPVPPLPYTSPTGEPPECVRAESAK